MEANINHCQGCTACCKLMAVQELAKPRCVWCTHISPDKHSCTIYEDRPKGCREWECGWLESQHSAIPLPPEMRPDISHVVIARGDSGTIWFHTDPGYPDAWRKGDVGQLLNKLVHAGHMVVITVNHKRIVFKKGIQPVHFYDKDPLTMEEAKANGAARSE